VKLVLTRMVPSMAGRPLFDPAALFAGGSVDWGFFAVAVLLYALHTPIQEFVARAGLQGSLQQFLRVPAGHADWKSIIISNIVFASAHTYLGFWFSMAAFASGLLWGWIFARQGSLVGPIVSHLAVGYWVLFALGLPAAFAFLGINIAGAWIWLGGVVVVLGGLMAIGPRRRHVPATVAAAEGASISGT